MKRKALIPTDLTFDDAQVANLRPPGGGGFHTPVHVPKEH